MKPLFVRQIWNGLSKRYPRFAAEINYLRRNRHYEPDLWLIPRFCRKNMNAVDVGVNMGVFSRWTAKYAKQVHGFECNPTLTPHLEKFLPETFSFTIAHFPVRLEKHLRFDPENTGIGTIESANKLDQNSGIKTIQSVEVQVRCLDEFDTGRISFIKIDVEGHELEVLQGARKLLERDHPVLLIEIEERHRPGNLMAVPEWLTELGYRAWVLEPRHNLVSASCLRDYAQAGANEFLVYVRNKLKKPAPKILIPLMENCFRSDTVPPFAQKEVSLFSKTGKMMKPKQTV
jgi:FkbM family methyltransferase